MSNFEDQLWSELVREYETATRTDQARLRKPWRARRIPLAVAGILLLAGIVGVVLSSIGHSTTAAYGVTLNLDGSVSLTLDEVVSVNGANEELAKLGVHALIAKVEPGCAATGEVVPAKAVSQIIQPKKLATGLGGVVWTIYPSAIPQGDTLLIAAQPDGSHPLTAVMDRFALYRGPAPACQLPIGSLPIEETTSGDNP
jgi:hypothetical protein